jgi:phenylacetate-coenzyme A ligase PaaK-like adenylate-forming protein
MAKLAAQARLLAFWLLDLSRGGIIRKHLKEIGGLLNPVQVKAAGKHEQYLKEILGHASSHCEFYSGLPLGADLSAFPVVNKSIIKTRQEEFLARGFDPARMYSVTTSGSTGTPFQSYQDKGKKQRNYADTIFFAELTGYKIGQRLFYLKIWVEKKMRSRIAYRFQNMCPVDVIHLNDREIQFLLSRMERHSSDSGILAYASALELICRYLDRIQAPPLKTGVKSIIAMSEALNEYTRTGMEKYFGVPVFSRYSNLENGIIAQQVPGEKTGFLVNSASYHVEILQMDSDEAVAEGELGRIVVTDLFNRAMPMIRYDTGDIGAMETDPVNEARQYLSTVEGRKLDLLYDTSGAIISSYLVYKNMWQYPEIDQYQLVQEQAKQYTFRINLRGSFEKEEQLVNEFKSFLGQDADFRVEYVSEIPLLASGKRRKIVNNYIRQ